MVTSFETRPANANDVPHIMALDHSCLSDYVWQLELRREPGQVGATFREVRLPRSVQVRYPRNPFALADEWTHRDMVLVAIHEGTPIGYICAVLEAPSALAWVTDLAVAPEQRRKGAASTLLTATQAWALERGVRRLILEMQSKNQAYIRLAQKFGYDFCGYNDQYYPTQDVALFFGRAVK
ncbi:MAG TPA: GNAT family N-acetyltransferase [Anaerolineales bacterium]|nr:GNAT family N-acetyltransferase [Anaerolineales bacterium]